MHVRHIYLSISQDFEANRLVAGLLQLSAGTRLIVDESAMTTGQLGPKGVNNLKALGKSLPIHLFRLA